MKIKTFCWNNKLLLQKCKIHQIFLQDLIARYLLECLVVSIILFSFWDFSSINSKSNFLSKSMTTKDSFFSVALSGEHRTVSILPQVSAHRAADGSVSTNFSCLVYWLRGGLGCKGVFCSYSPSLLTGGASEPSRLVARTWRCAELPSVCCASQTNSAGL